MLTLYIADVERDAGMKKLSREEAAKVLEGMKVKIEIPKAAVTQWERNAALDMAIEVLNCSEIPNKSDTISRQAAVELAMKYCPDDDGAVQCDGDIRGLLDELENLPAAQPEQKTDEWIPISKETNPTKSGWYLVTVHEDVTNDNERFTGMAEFNATNGMWYDIDEPTDMYLRWMPLPAP